MSAIEVVKTMFDYELTDITDRLANAADEPELCYLVKWRGLNLTFHTIRSRYIAIYLYKDLPSSQDPQLDWGDWSYWWDEEGQYVKSIEVFTTCTPGILKRTVREFISDMHTDSYLAISIKCWLHELNK